MVMLVILVVIQLVVNCSASDDLSETVRTLKAQVNALLERRQEDYRILEESLRKSLEKSSELSALRKEVTTLR